MTDIDELPAAQPILPGVGDSWSGFPAALILGPEAFEGPDGEQLADEIADRVAAVAERRRYPLHTAVAFNALHWDYDWADDSDLGRYDEAALNALATTVQFDGRGATVDAVPVGAFIWLQPGNKGAIWAEVVGKDGRPDGGGDWSVPRELSGGLSGRVVDEAWCVDPQVFDRTARHTKKLATWAFEGLLDKRCLVDVRADYGSTVAGEEADVAYFVRWMIEHAAGALAAGALGGSFLERPDAETVDGRMALTGALVAALAAIDEALDRSDRFRRWGDFWIPAGWVTDIDDRPNLPFGRADLSDRLMSIARSASSDQYGWATLGPRLEEFADRMIVNSESRGTSHLAPEDPMVGGDWLRRVVVSARWIGDQLVETGGLVQTGPSSVRYVRCDDRWPWGGVWMSGPEPGPASLLWNVLPDEPLGLGYGGFESLDPPEPDEEDFDAVDEDAPVPPPPEPAGEEPADGDETGTVKEPEPEPEPAGDEPVDEERDDERDEDQDLDATHVILNVTLRATDIDNGTLLLPERFEWLIDRLDAGRPVTVALRNVGELEDERTLHPLTGHDGLLVREIDWPMDFAPGIRLLLVALNGGQTLHVSNRMISEPFGSGHLYEPEFHGGHDRGHRLTLAAVAVDALKRNGRSTYDSRRATAEQITEVLFGSNPGRRLVGAVRVALDQLVEQGKLGMAGSEYSIADASADPTREHIRPTGAAAATPRVADVRAHVVHPFLRALQPGHRASRKKRDEFRRVHGFELPAGRTWVSEHLRGAAVEAWRDALEGVETDDGPLTPAQVDQIIEERFHRR